MYGVCAGFCTMYSEIDWLSLEQAFEKKGITRNDIVLESGFTLGAPTETISSYLESYDEYGNIIESTSMEKIDGIEKNIMILMELFQKKSI